MNIHEEEFTYTGNKDKKYTVDEFVGKILHQCKTTGDCGKCPLAYDDDGECIFKFRFQVNKDLVVKQVEDTFNNQEQ